MDLGAGAQVTGLQIYARSDASWDRLADLEVRLGDTDPNNTALNTAIAANSIYAKYAGPPTHVTGVQVHLVL